MLLLLTFIRLEFCMLCTIIHSVWILNISISISISFSPIRKIYIMQWTLPYISLTQLTLKQERINYIIMDIYISTHIFFWQLYQGRFCPCLNMPSVQRVHICLWCASYTIEWGHFSVFLFCIRAGVLYIVCHS